MVNLIKKRGGKKMPITKKDYKKLNTSQKKGTRKEKIEEFLKKNAGYAYNAEEIAKSTKISINTIHRTLQKLLKENKITHRKPYYMWK